MATGEFILADLRAVLAEGHDTFSFLSLYKGVPLICRAQLKKVAENEALFVVQPPESAALQREAVTLVLSDGLLEPLEARVTCLDLAKGEFSLSHFTYAGSKFANRRELRVEPAGGESVIIASDGRVMAGEIADISVRGLGVRMPLEELKTTFTQGKLIAVTLGLPESKVQLEGKIRSLVHSPHHLRLAIEFSGAIPEKATIIHYVMKRRSEIIAEVRQLYMEAIRAEE